MGIASLGPWLRRKGQRQRKTPRTGRISRPLPLSLEILETRTMPTAVSWVGGATGDWGVTANWFDGTTNRLPGAGDDVSIGAGVTVRHSTGTDQIHSLTDQGALEFSGGILDLAAASAVSTTGSFTLSGGTLQGAGDLTLNSLFVWTGGTMSGTGHTRANGTMLLSGSSNVVLDTRTLDNTGTATWTTANSYYLILNNGAVINNLPGAVLDLQSDGGISAGGVLNNAGTITKSGTGG
ncbi:MAG TPA: hypothetical protein VGY66_00020, partial [Gemmataceae bacterium]|nr:hypothetical protein [Gemmataceae bacterium]